jgi:UMF1 family MFS transporter
VLALVMGGTQSVSRAIMGRMTPAHRTAEFFGFFNFSGKATSFLGTFLFGLVIQITGSARLSVLSLLVFFLIGLALAWRIDVAEGRRQAVAET